MAKKLFSKKINLIFLSFILIIMFFVAVPVFANSLKATYLSLTIGRNQRWLILEPQFHIFLGYGDDKKVETRLNDILKVANIPLTSLKRLTINASASKIIDTDKDGLSDEIEKLIGTNPRLTDTNNNKYSDWQDLYNGYDPVNNTGKLTYNVNAPSQVQSFLKKENNFICGRQVIWGNKYYDTIQIGNQCWLKQNLDYGEMVMGKVRQIDNKKPEKYCYENKLENCAKFGGLYLWGEARQYAQPYDLAGVQGICPPGWKLPTKEEFNYLLVMLGEKNNWINRFNLVFTGVRMPDGSFKYPSVTRFWTSSSYDIFFSWLVDLSNNTDKVYQYYATNNYGFSVRCLKNLR